MKRLLLILGLLASTIVFAQQEPEAIEGKDLIEVDNPEFEDEAVDIEMDHFMMDLEMPAIETEETTKTAETTKASETAKPKSENKSAKTKIIESDTALTVNQLKKNDLVRIENNQPRIYRRVNGNIVKYKLRNGINLGSSGLEKKSEQNYYVRNADKLLNDTRELRKQKEEEEKQVAQEEAAKEPVALGVDDAVRAKRAEIEASQNNGKEIEKEILLKNLRTNDMIYLFDEVQLVVRKKKATSGYDQYWLMEAIDPEHPSLLREGNSKFKVLKSYR